MYGNPMLVMIAVMVETAVGKDILFLAKLHKSLSTACNHGNK
jgi:hypothetical protein